MAREAASLMRFPRTRGTRMCAAPSTSDRILRARIAACTRWSHEPDRRAATAPARAGLELRFVREVDPDGRLSPQELARRVKSARQAYFSRLALKSAQARRRAS
jgi:hypothetical protein